MIGVIVFTISFICGAAITWSVLYIEYVTSGQRDYDKMDPETRKYVDNICSLFKREQV